MVLLIVILTHVKTMELVLTPLLDMSAIVFQVLQVKRVALKLVMKSMIVQCIPAQIMESVLIFMEAIIVTVHPVSVDWIVHLHKKYHHHITMITS